MRTPATGRISESGIIPNEAVCVAADGLYFFSDMKYTLTLDVPRSKEWGLNLSESALFSWLFSVPSWADKAILEGEVWYFAARSKAIEETSGIITDKPDTIYRLYKSLEAKGVIEWQKIGPKDYIQITAKGACWNSDKKTEVGKFSEQPRKKIRITSEKNPTYNNIIDNEINDKEGTPAEFHVQTIALETIPTVEGEVPRPTAQPTSKISELQKNINAHSEAAEHFLRLLQTKGHSLNGAEKYAAAYFLNEQRKTRWVSLLIPTDAGAEHRWLGEHGPGIIQWAQRQPQFERNNGTQPAPPVATGMRLVNPENAPR